MKFDVSQLSVRDKYKLLSGCITPRPIAFVSTLSAEGRVNLAPYSFFNGISAEPMAVAFSPLVKQDGTDKDTVRNCLPVGEGGTGEFVLNFVAEGYVQKMAACAEPLPHGDSEFEFAGLESAPSEVVAPPRVARSPVAFECRTLQVVRLAPGVPMSGCLIIGEVVYVHAHEGVVGDAMHVSPDGLRTVGRLGGPSYCTTRDRFPMQRGRAALDDPAPWVDEEG